MEADGEQAIPVYLAAVRAELAKRDQVLANPALRANEVCVCLPPHNASGVEECLCLSVWRLVVRLAAH